MPGHGRTALRALSRMAAGLLLGASAHAQMLQGLIGLGASPAGPEVFAGLSAHNIGTLGTTPYGLWTVDGRLSVDVTRGRLYVNTDVLFVTPTPFGSAYVGGGLHFAPVELSGPPVFAALLAGAEYPLAGRTGLFAEGAARHNGARALFAVRAGLSRTFY